MLSDDHPIRVTDPNYKTAAQSDLATWLAKEAEGGVKPENNENTSTVRYGDLYDTPPAAKMPPPADPPHAPFPQNTENYTRAQKERRDVAGRAYATTPAAEQADQALLGANFDHARSGDFTAHSLLLQSKTKEASATLNEQTHRLGLGRRG
jgi:hypothetical protein